MARAGGYPELGYTSDPVVLVPGSLSGLRADIDDLTARAEDLALAAEDLARGYVSSWQGETAVAANEHRVALVDALTVNSDLYRVVATVLAGHVDTIRWARARASVAVGLWEQAKALGAVEIRGPATPSSRGGWPPPAPSIVGEGRGADLAEAAQLNRPGFRGGSQPTEDESHGSTEEVPGRAPGAGDPDGGGPAS